MVQWREWLKALGSLRLGASLSTQVDDGRGWEQATSGAPSEWLNAAEAYQDALEAWRKNPLAWRIIAITTDYVVGEGVTVSSSQGEVQAFIERFWNHPRNQLDLRLEAMCDELSRAGDLFVLLFRNPQDGLSYLRFVTKDRIRRIQTAENDWEAERAYIELDGTQERRWLAPQDPQAQAQEAAMLHYAVNRPIGCLLGESDLAALIPWLQRYVRLLEDRVRLNWAMRAFLWIVTVPSHRVAAKAEQYRVAPEAGSIIVKDESESWQPVTPNLHAFDASADLKAVRQMIDAGSHYPPHWRGEPQGINLATAAAMQAPTEKHLQRRQRYFHFVLKDILIQAYLRADEIGKVPYHPPEALQEWITVSGTELSLKDNERLANAAVQLARAFNLLASTLPTLSSPSLRQAMLQQVLSFGGLSVSPSLVQRILEELEA